MCGVKSVAAGYVYILEVKDIDLPVCKIGMTSRTPSQRCNEINRSSTGDFIWAVAHQIAVNDCQKLESLVHSKRAPLRQKRREFFGLCADDANAAISSILNSQSEIEIIDEIAHSDSEELNIPTSKNKTSRASYRKIETEYADLLLTFANILNVKGRPFGKLNKSAFGMSDGNTGVQWNLAVLPEVGDVKMGVNLEGSEKTGKWLIAPFILSELSDPSIDKIKAEMRHPDEVFLRFSRDAWQGASRPAIKEKFLGGREFSLNELDSNLWISILEEALTCLDPEKGYRGRRKKQIVTLASDGREVEKDISPHLTIIAPLSLGGNIEENITNRISDLKPLYDWVVRVSSS